MLLKPMIVNAVRSTGPGICSHVLKCSISMCLTLCTCLSTLTVAEREHGMCRKHMTCFVVPDLKNVNTTQNPKIYFVVRDLKNVNTNQHLAHKMKTGWVAQPEVLARAPASPTLLVNISKLVQHSLNGLSTSL